MASPPKPPATAADAPKAAGDAPVTGMVDTSATEQAHAAAEAAAATAAAAHVETDTPFDEKDVAADGANAVGNDPLNSQTTAAVANVDFLVAALSPAQSQAMLDAVMVQTLSLAMQNAILRQQTDRVVSAAVVSAACARMLEIAGLPPAVATPSAPPTPSPHSPSQRAKPVAAASPAKATVRKAPAGGAKTRKTA